MCANTRLPDTQRMTKDHFKGLNRREFLTACALGALPGLLAACQTTPSQVGNATPSPVRQPSPSASASPSPPTGADWSALSASLQGTLVQPGSQQYSTALQLFNTRFDRVQPAAIAYCQSTADVQTCLAFAHRFGLP